MKNKIYKYNMMIYYQSFFIYLFALIVYVLLRIQFVGFQFEIILKDPITNLFMIIIAYVILTTVYNFWLKREIVIQENQIVLSSKLKKKIIDIESIIHLSITRERKFQLSGLLRVIKIKIKDYPRTVVIHPLDYENGDDLLAEFSEIRNKVEQKIKGNNA